MPERTGMNLEPQVSYLDFPVTQKLKAGQTLSPVSQP